MNSVHETVYSHMKDEGTEQDLVAVFTQTPDE